MLISDLVLDVMVPGRVVGKGRPRFVRATGRAYTPAQTLSAENAIRFALAEEFDGDPLDEPLTLRLTVWCDVPASKSKKYKAAALNGMLLPVGKPDLDNIVKLVGDAGNGIVWKDDSRIAELHVRRRYGEAPALHIAVEKCA